jgi:lantibiotic modifying enzyme
MPSTRREFLARTAGAAAVVGFGPAIAPFVHASQRNTRPHLDVAVRCAQWIARSTQDHPQGAAWPADPLRPSSVGLDYYNGMPGVVAFFADLHAASGDARWLDLSRRGAAYLRASWERAGATFGDGLYTGLAGHAVSLRALARHGGGAEWEDAARDATRRIVARAKPVGDGVEWSASNDIISGTAGIGLYLLQAGAAWKDASLVDTAAKAGRRLLAMGVAADGGRMWFPGGTTGRNYPNFSHGTSGVAYFLATLYQHTRDRAFLDGALAGATYLEAVATARDGTRAIFHVSGDGENRFYLSWCHGPVGTARLFHRLHQITGDAKCSRWVDELTATVVASGVPEQRTAGYWNNISQCCGNVGIGQYYIDLARYRPTAAIKGLRERVESNTLSRAADDADGLRWVQAENRVQPENLVAQTGFMQGAAGVGSFFLQLDAFARDRAWPTPLPDTPWTTAALATA